jgi:hypothetical protein
MSDFHNLIEREIPRLRRYARALTRSGDRADDLVQDVFQHPIGTPPNVGERIGIARKIAGLTGSRSAPIGTPPLDRFP